MQVSRRQLIALPLAFAAAGAGPAAAGSMLADPFDPARPRRIDIRPMAAPACGGSFPVVESVVGVGYYVDKSHSVIDEDKRTANVAINKPLIDYVAQVEASVAAWLASRGQSQEAAGCGLRLLRAWAQGDALMGKFNEQGRGTRRWNATALAISYLALRHALPDRHDPAIAVWLARLGLGCRADGERLKNNHLNWTASAVAACAVGANDRTAFDWAVAAARRGIGEIQPDGSLPLELARGSRALNYHSFALGPLLLVAELAGANGIDLYSEGNGALARLAAFILRNNADPAEVARLAHASQEWSGFMPWIELWARRSGDAAAVALAARTRPINFPYLGGNQTLLFGA